MPVTAHKQSAAALPLRADVWPAHALASASMAVLPTGDAVLDAQLPAGGWPIGALVEILQPPGVHSEWRLLLPALARSGGGAVVLTGAPYVPFAPALQAQGLRAQRLLLIDTVRVSSRLWASEQALRCADVDAVLVWLPQVHGAQLRRLQMAAAGFDKLLFVMRPQAARADASPAALRLHVVPQALYSEPPGAANMATFVGTGTDALAVQVLKRRGPPLEKSLALAARNVCLSMLLAAG